MANIDQVQLPDGSQYHIIDDTSGYATTNYVQDQIATINKNTIGLGNVDNTADINKPVSLPQQDALNGKIDDDIVAYVEGDTTATKRHVVGDQFILNGVLYTATAIIAVNDTIVIGTNCEASDTLVEQNDALSARIDTKTDQSLIATVQPNLTAVKAYAVGEQFVYQGLLYKATAAISSGGTITINGNCTLADSVTEQISHNYITSTNTVTPIVGQSVYTDFTLPNDGKTYICNINLGCGGANKSIKAQMWIGGTAHLDAISARLVEWSDMPLDCGETLTTFATGNGGNLRVNIWTRSTTATSYSLTFSAVSI